MRAGGGGGEGASDAGAGFGEPQFLEVVVLVLQSQVYKESHRGMLRVHEGPSLRISGCNTELVGLRCVREQ